MNIHNQCLDSSDTSSKRELPANKGCATHLWSHTVTTPRGVFLYFFRFCVVCSLAILPANKGGFDTFVITHKCDNTAGCMCTHVPCACGLKLHMSSRHEMPVNTRGV